MMMKTKIKFLFFCIFICSTYCLSQSVDAILEKADAYRRIGDSFRMNVRITDFKNNLFVEEAVFRGFFLGNDRSLLLCEKGKNRGMKVLMRGDYMWVSLLGSRRALRITPMQRLMGQASLGDVAKVSFSLDYAVETIEKDKNRIILLLKAKSKGATYQKVTLYVDPADYKPKKAEFFLLSGKHFKTAFFEEFMSVEGRTVTRKIRIEDETREGAYSVLEYRDYQRENIPDKYFNVMFLPKLELD